jgi:group I intron endonuclease
MKTCGIYRIVNTVNGRSYVGSSVDVCLRFRKHVWKLRGDNHENLHLQSAWNKYGALSFRLEVVEVCDRSVLFFREQHYLDIAKIDSDSYYNMNYIASKPPSPRGRVVLDVTRKKLSVLRMGNKNPQYGKRLNEKTKLKMGASHSKFYVFVSPQNEIVKINNVAKFCRENGLVCSGMYNVQNGWVEQYRGWRKYIESKSPESSN